MAVDSPFVQPSRVDARSTELPLRTVSTDSASATSPRTEQMRSTEAGQSEVAAISRNTSVTLAVPLDGEEVARSKRQASATVHGTRKLLRRDSLDRREAVLRGKEGSRARRRWENDRLLNNPHAEPPLPSDWEIRPTYPRRTIPYYLAPLWDAAEFQRAIESKLDDKRKRLNSQKRRRHGKNGSVSSIDRFNVGISPMEEAASNIPKEIRARLKHARSAKGLLQDLEENVRSFVRCWNERELKLREEGLGDAPLPVPQSLALRVKQDRQRQTPPPLGQRPFQSINLAQNTDDDDDDEEDEEIVFVGRNGAMHDMPSSPMRPTENLTTQANDADEGEMISLPSSPSASSSSSSIIATEKLIFQALESDKGAAFARWLVHCVGSYYGLRSWSVTRTVEGQVKREAYVGIDSRVRGFMGPSRCVDFGDRKEIELPRPLWAMV